MTTYRDPPVNGLPNTWAPVDLAAIVEGVRSGQLVGPVPTLMTRTDGVPLLYPGEVHSLAGEPESGKGWVTLATCTAVISAGDRVLYLDFEDSPASIVSRLLALGADDNAIINQFTYVRPSDPFTPVAFFDLLNGHQFTLAVIDGVSEAYSLLGLDPYSNPDAALFLTALPRPLAARGAAVLEIDHVVKSKDTRSRYALGAQHKLAGVAVAYSTDVVSTPSRTSSGLTKIKVEKDRHGHVRGHANAGVIALAHIVPEDDGDRVTVTLDAPSYDGKAAPEFRPTAIMEKVSRLIEQQAGLGLNAVRGAISSKAEHVDQALRLLEVEGFIEERREGQAHRHYSLTPYRQEANRVPASLPRPDRVPDTVGATASPRPPPYKGDANGRGANQSSTQGNHVPPEPTDPDAELERLQAKYGADLDTES